ncbi:peptidase S8 and S53, subtilisin, kexin, sedolisin [Pseudomonas sp. StFLB209]|uniref:DUF4214 domain-containing protein n=1 Tax=Pseudomonas sp. StFLB209 TaxID=1028989 RepID=UPI0004F6F3C0|nr:DUF4214 domain-containing protein [Pseudomonas sp. StFLB209]BAP46035.1 peptidase S8 and S53, subtilisin, kexin, sedolisin [Pseudomonas sp. StFLB209]
MSFQSDLAELYTAFFNRAPDAGGLAYWVNELSNGNMSLESISANWANEQAEALEKYPSSLSTDAFIEAVYNNIFGRSGDSGGVAYWKTELENNGMSREVFIAAVLNGAKANTSTQGQADAALVNNKALVGVAFAEKGLTDLSLAVKVLSAVSSDADTLTATLDLIKLVPADPAAQTSAILTLVSSTLDQVAQLIKTAPAEVKNLATYLETVVANVSSGTNLTTLLTTINTKTTAALTDPTALANPATQAGNDVGTATPGTGGGTVTPTFTVTETSAGHYTVGNGNGNVTLSLVNDKYVFTPAVGSSVSINKLDVSSLTVDSIKLSPTTTVYQLGTNFSDIEINGTGTLVIPFLKGEDLSVQAASHIANTYDIKVDLNKLANVYGSQADLLAFYNLASTDVAGLSTLNARVTETLNIAQLSAFDDQISGPVLATSILDTATALKTNTTYVKGPVNLEVSGPVTLADLNALGIKITGTVSFETLSSTASALIKATFTPGTGTVTLTDLDLNGNVLGVVLTAKQFNVLKTLVTTQAWYADVEDTALNLLQLTQGETRNTNSLTLVNDAAGTLTVQQRSDLAKMIYDPNDTEWTYSLSDTAKNLLASKINDATVLAGAEHITVVPAGPISIADYNELQSTVNLSFPNSGIVLRDTLTNLGASALTSSHDYIIADSVANLDVPVSTGTSLVIDAQGFVVADSIANITAAQTNNSSIFNAPGYTGVILSDTISNLVVPQSLQGQNVVGVKVVDFVAGGVVTALEGFVLSIAENSNEFINNFSVSGAVTDVSNLPEYGLKYASALALQATAGNDALNGNISDGKITVTYTSAAQADTFSFSQGAFKAADGSFDTYSAFYGSLADSNRDHINLSSFQLSNNDSQALQQGSITTVSNGGYAFVKGIYADGEFVASQNGNSEDTLVVWDADTGSGIEQVAIVLVGQSPNNAGAIVNLGLV